MYTLSLAEKNEQILVARVVLIEHERPIATYNSFGSFPSFGSSCTSDLYNVIIADAIIRREYTYILHSGAWKLDTLILKEEGSAIAHIIKDGWMSDLQYESFPMFDGQSCIRSLTIRCLDLIFCNLSNSEVYKSKQEPLEVIRDIVIFKSGVYNE